MASLRGMGLGRGIALGTAAVVRLRNGFPVPPPIPPRIVEQLAKRHVDETPDVILVADDYQTAIAMAASVRWGNVVGIAAASAPPEALVGDVPAVVNVVGLLEQVQDDMLMVVDAGRGVVVADPDGMAFAQYQAERNQLAPRQRLYLDEGHLHAQTLDGHAVQVYAQVFTLEDVSTALENGADALVVPFDCDLLPADRDEEEQRSSLLMLIQHAGGKPLLLTDEYALPAALLLEAAVRTDLTVSCPLKEYLEGLGVGELGQELNEARADCLASNILCDLPRLAVVLPARHGLTLDDAEQAVFFVDRLAYNGAMRLVVNIEYATLDAELLASLDTIISAANATMLPVYVTGWLTTFGQSTARSLEEHNLLALQQLVGAGVAAVVAPPHAIAAVKVSIADVNFSECRETLTNFLNEGANS